MTESVEFPFPDNLTRRERRLFEENAGITIGQLGTILSDTERHREITTQIEAALILIAVRRKIPTATIDDVFDNDAWVLASPVAQEVPPAPLPTPTATN